MPILTAAEAIQKRDQLVNDGFCIIPGVLQGDLLERVRAYTDDLFARKKVDNKYRYQGSDFHIGTQRKHDDPKTSQWWKNVVTEVNPVIDELVDLPAAWEACRLIGLENQVPDEIAIILSKPPHAPPLYWHQDMMNWNSPEAATPWPTRIFLSYYMTDTNEKNGCLRAIPGTHLRRIPLHDSLPAAHGPEIQAITDYDHHPAFSNHPDAVDLPCKAGDLAINDARVLHAAYANQTDYRRTLVLQWHTVFNFPNPPSWWTSPIPDAIKKYDPNGKYEPTRTPSEYLAR